MKPRNYKYDELLEVIWIDADNSPDWYDEDEIKKDAKTTFKQYGCYTRHTQDFLYLSYGIGIEGNKDRSYDAVPWGCIKKIRRIKT